MAYRYKEIVCAGTFDRFHKGHQAFISYAFTLGEKVFIAITSDKYTTIHKSHVAPFALRKKTVSAFLKKKKFFQRARIVAIDDMYGITLDVANALEAIVVTEETIQGAHAVNFKRKSFGLPPLAIELAPIERNEAGIRLSSSLIRKGLFNKKGALQIKNELMTIDLLLPVTLRETLQKPFGHVMKQVPQGLDGAKIVAIGDVTTQHLHRAGYQQVVSCIDFVVERKEQNMSLDALGFSKDITILHAKNPPATITPDLWTAAQKACQLIARRKKSVIVVEGEEDLAVLPFLLLLPEGFSICYGQPHEGMVIVGVTEKSKEQALLLLSRFYKSTRGY